jgi:ionotropic glutamate receptor NMDA 2B
MAYGVVDCSAISNVNIEIYLISIAMFSLSLTFLRALCSQIGVWKSWEKEGLDIKDIVWPGNSHTPPQGVPEKFHMKITFLEEPPYISLAPPDPVTGKCNMNRGVLCRVANETQMDG